MNNWKFQLPNKWKKYFTASDFSVFINKAGDSATQIKFVRSYTSSKALIAEELRFFNQKVVSFATGID